MTFRALWALLVTVCLVMGGCQVGEGGRDSGVAPETDGPGGKGDDLSEEELIQLEGAARVEGLREAIDWFATSATSSTFRRNSQSFRTLVEGAQEIMAMADNGSLAEEDEEALRSDIVPMLHRVVGAVTLFERFAADRWKEQEQIDYAPFFGAAAMHGTGPYWAMERWDNGSYAGLTEVMSEDVGADQGSCNPDNLNYNLTMRSIALALENDLYKLMLLPGEFSTFRSNPSGYVDWLVQNVPTKGGAQMGVEIELEAAVDNLLSLDDAAIEEMRNDNIASLQTAVAAMRMDAPGASQLEHGGDEGQWCEDNLYMYAAINPLMGTPAAVELYCETSRVPSAADLDVLVSDVDEAADEYIAKMAEAYDMSADKGARHLTWHNPAGVAQTLYAVPRCGERTYQMMQDAADNEESRKWWLGAVMWTTAIVGVVALATGIGAPIAAGLGFISAAAAGTLLIVATVASVAVGLSAAAYLGYEGARLRAEAQHDLMVLVLTGYDGADVHKRFDEANALIMEASVTGVLAILEIVVVLKALRIARAAKGADEDLGEALYRSLFTRAALSADELANFCFAAGTMIAVESGLKAIEDIEVGDRVWSRDEKTGEEALRPVTGLSRTEDREVMDMTFMSLDGHREVVRATPSHPFWSLDDGDWEQAGDMSVGEAVRTRKGPIWLMSAAPVEEAVTVYNFEVDELHTYFVGDGRLWVHNSCWTEVAEHVIKGKHPQIGDQVFDIAKMSAKEIDEAIEWGSKYLQRFAASAQKRMECADGAMVFLRRNELMIINATSQGTYVQKSSVQIAHRVFRQWIEQHGGAKVL